MWQTTVGPQTRTSCTSSATLMFTDNIEPDVILSHSDPVLVQVCVNASSLSCTLVNICACMLTFYAVQALPNPSTHLLSKLQDVRVHVLCPP